MKSAALIVFLAAAVVAASLLFGALGFAVALALLVVWMAIGRSVLDPVDRMASHVATRPEPIVEAAGEPLRETLLTIDRNAQARQEAIARMQLDGRGDNH
jgi:hypothetical protein